MIQSLPDGILTFLFTDIESSTQLWEQLPDAMKSALQRHDAILRQAVESGGGMIVKNTGDGCLAVFRTAPEAVAGALAAQRALAADPWPEIAPRAVRVRMALVTGEAELRAGDYYGPAVNRAARLMAAGYGGQILLSGITAELAGQQLPPEASLHDLGNHRLKDLSSPEHVYQLLAPGLQAGFPALKSQDATPSNLPAQLTSFVGRRRELAEATERLASTRLLTVVGPGGTGKTRLVIQLAAGLLEQYPNGAWLVELAPVSDPGLVLQNVAAAFDLREQPGLTLQELVISYLQAKHLLLILDNCEHLIVACARLADDLLRNCPQLKIIASSREALGTAGEAVYPLPSLGLPGDKGADLGSIRQSEAVQLFMERAITVQPHFNLSEQNVAAVAKICRRLDGIPLAIELAAVRVRLLAPEQIASRLDDRFRLLTGGSRAALPRQQTLQALIDWSYDLLSEKERGMFRRLAVFAGGWSLEAAEAVCFGFDVLDIMADLVNKSLVASEESRDGSMRYRLLETMRQYGQERLLEAGETSEARDRHLAYFLQDAESGERDYFGPRETSRFNALEVDVDNFRAALQWGLERDPEAALRLAGALSQFWLRRRATTEAYLWLNDALQRVDALPQVGGDVGLVRRRAQAKAFLGLGSALIAQGLNRQALEALNHSERIYRELGDESWWLPYSVGMQALPANLSGQYDLGWRKAQEALALADGNALAMAMVYGVMGNFMLFFTQDIEIARTKSLEALHYAQVTGYQWAIQMASIGLGRIEAYEKNWDEAQRLFQAAQEGLQEMGDVFFTNVARSEQGHLERHRGDLDTALKLYRQCLPVWRELGQRAAVAHELECIAFILRAHACPSKAARLLAAAQEQRQEIGSAMNPYEQVEYDADIAALNDELTSDELEKAWNEGRRLDIDQAIALALSD